MKKEKSATHLILPWRATGIISICICVALSLSLVVTLRTKNQVDSLASIALALAIITFIVQIIVFIAQSNATNQQLVHASELHGLTSEALALIIEKIEGTRQEMHEVRDRTIEVLMSKSTFEAKKAEQLEGSESVGAADAWQTTEGVTVETGITAERVNDNPVGANVVSETEVRLKGAVLPTLTDAVEIDSLLNEMESLSIATLMELEELRVDFIRYSPSDSDGINILLEAKNLFDGGYAIRVPGKKSPQPVWVLTKKGQRAVSLLTNVDYSSLPQQRRLKALIRAKNAADDLALADFTIRQNAEFPVSLPEGDVEPEN